MKEVEIKYIKVIEDIEKLVLDALNLLPEARRKQFIKKMYDEL